MKFIAERKLLWGFHITYKHEQKICDHTIKLQTGLSEKQNISFIGSLEPQKYKNHTHLIIINGKFSTHISNNLPTLKKDDTNQT